MRWVSFLGWVLFFSSLTAFSAVKYEPELSSFRATLGSMIQLDTSSPPGNEARIVKLVAQRLSAERIGYEIVPFAEGRESIVARLKGTGQEKPLLLLAHIDVVGTANQTWSTDPHVMTEKDGYLYGRGVRDDLGMAALELEVFIMLKRSGVPLRRDVILALTGDEETGGRGVHSIFEERPGLIDAGIALNEGGGVMLGSDGKVKLVALQTAEKTYEDFSLVATGPTGHSSLPRKGNAIYRLARALERWSHFQFPPKLLPVTRAYFERRAALEPPRLAAAMRALAGAKATLPAGPLKVVEKEPVLASELRTTCVATLLSGGTKENALPPEAHANVNCRILPGESPASVQAQIAAVIGDPKIKILPAQAFETGGASPTEGEVPEAVQKISREIWPEVAVIPSMSQGATDSRFLREKGIAAYGLNPIPQMETDLARAHGVDERIPSASLSPGMEFLHRLVLQLAAKRT